MKKSLTTTCAIAAEIISAPDDHLYFQIQAAHFCLVMACGMTKDKPYRNRGENGNFSVIAAML